MAKPLLDDALWRRLEPLFPMPRPRRSDHPGRRPLSARQVLTGILFVLKTGIPWQELPCELGCGSGMSCLRYLRAWRRSGVWQAVVEVLRAELPLEDRIDWLRAEENREPKGARRIDRHSRHPPRGPRHEITHETHVPPGGDPGPS